MTSTVKVTAHCGADKLVQVQIKQGDAVVQTLTFPDTEERSFYVYDQQNVSVSEIAKPGVEVQPVTPAPTPVVPVADSTVGGDGPTKP